MKIHVNTGGIAQTNAFLVADEVARQAVIIDAPNGTTGPLLDIAAREKWEVIGLWLTHGHFDHIGDLLSLATLTDAKIACIFDMTTWLKAQGVEEQRLVGFNKGGTVEVAGIRATMTKAEHSSTYNDNGTLLPLGEAVGYVLRMDNGFTIYHTGDTAVTYDMLIVGDLYQPDLTILPIGDHFTMDPRKSDRSHVVL